MEFAWMYLVVEKPGWVSPVAGSVTALTCLTIHLVSRAVKRPVSPALRFLSLPACFLQFISLEHFLTLAAFGFPDAGLCILFGPPRWVRYASLLLAASASLLLATATTPSIVHRLLERLRRMSPAE